jgi:ribosomal protein L31E
MQSNHQMIMAIMYQLSLRGLTKWVTKTAKAPKAVNRRRTKVQKEKKGQQINLVQ